MRSPFRARHIIDGMFIEDLVTRRYIRKQRYHVHITLAA